MGTDITSSPATPTNHCNTPKSTPVRISAQGCFDIYRKEGEPMPKNVTPTKPTSGAVPRMKVRYPATAGSWVLVGGCSKAGSVVGSAPWQFFKLPSLSCPAGHRVLKGEAGAGWLPASSLCAQLGGVFYPLNMPQGRPVSPLIVRGSYGCHDVRRVTRTTSQICKVFVGGVPGKYLDLQL